MQNLLKPPAIFFGNKAPINSMRSSVIPICLAAISKQVKFRLIKGDTELLLGLSVIGGIRFDSGLQTAYLPSWADRMESDG